MELRHLRYFIRAAELLHFTRAAESLYISQPSLSIHIQQLEEELNCKLFARVGRNVYLTEAGKVMLASAKRAVGDLENAGKEIEAMTGLLRGTLTLATIPLYGSKVLPKLIEVFHTEHPNVHINVRAVRAEDVEAGLINGTFDLGFSLAPPEHTEINTKAIFKDQIVMAVSKEHVLAKKKKVTVADLNTVKMALPNHKISSTRMMGVYFEALGITPNIVIEQDDGHALMELVKFGSVVTFLPEMAMREDPNLVLLALPEPGIATNIAAMWLQLNAASKAFLELASSEIAYGIDVADTKA